VTEIVTPEDVAWCGGVIDVLGLLRLRDTDAGARLPSVFISTPYAPIAQRLAYLTGMTVTTVTREYKRVGCSDHCTEPHLHVVSATARWSLTGSRAQVFLKAVRPYLFVKGAECDELLEASANARFKPATAAKMHELGWPA
jgi:hypothetical protein